MIRSGADYIAVHYESLCNHKQIFDAIRKLGAKPVLAFRCETPVPNDFIEYAKQVEWIIKLTVDPGFSGQRINRNALQHIREMRKQLDITQLNIAIEADGNINSETIPEVISSGATILTGGTSGLFNDKGSIEENYQAMLEAACL